MSRYRLNGRWYPCKPNSKIRYDSTSESESEEGKDAKKIDHLVDIKPKQSKIETPKIDTGSISTVNIPSKENLSQSKVVEQKTKPKIRKNLNL